jgi:large subunit ribosomal protein L10
LTRTEKEQLVQELTTEFTEASALIACGYETMNVQELESFRKVAREADIKVKVIKNSLASIAATNAEKPGMELAQMNLFVWGEDVAAVAKAVTNFAKDNDKLVVKTGFIDGIVDAAAIEAYSKLPSKEEMLGMLLATWTAPLRNTLYVWSAKQRELVTVLSAIKDQKEG